MTDSQKSLASAALLGALTGPVAAQTPPSAPQVPHTVKIHGVELPDPYAWLRDRKNPNTLAYLKAENSYADQAMAPTRKLQKSLYQEMLSRIQEDDEKPAYRQGDYGYFVKTVKGQAYPIYCRVPWGKKKPVQVLVDLNELAKGKDYLDLHEFEPSPDGRWLAYSLDTTGYRQYRLYVKDLSTGQVLDEGLQRVTSVAWGADNRTLFYTTEDEVTKRSDRFWRHQVGQKGSTELYYETDPLFDIACGSSRDQSLILLLCYSKTSTEVRFLSAAGGKAEMRTIRTRQPYHEYSADYHGGRFVIRTNQDAPLFKLVSASLAHPEQWHDLLLPPKDTQVDDFLLFPKYVAVKLRSRGVPGLSLLDSQGKLREIQFREKVRSVSFGDNEEPTLPTVRVDYESPVTPPTTYDVDLDSGKLKQIRRLPVPNYDASRYQCERWMATARDGVQVPVTLLYLKGTRPGTPHPMFLEAYGSYGAIDDPDFVSSRFSLVDRGVVWAYAHIRGSGDLGEPWRQAGRMLTKMNTFHDFIDCAEGLQKAGWTRADRLVCSGASAGGMLMGGVANMRPDLFKALVVKVPFVDVINTMLDASLPLTTSEYIEWGNPNEKEAFDYMLRYSPYDNVRAQPYPAMLVKVSLNDSQVPYWEGAKLVARLRQMKTDNHPLLLKTNMAAGHGGSSGRYARLKERAYDFAFSLWQMGLLK